VNHGCGPVKHGEYRRACSATLTSFAGPPCIVHVTICPDRRLRFSIIEVNLLGNLLEVASHAACPAAAAGGYAPVHPQRRSDRCQLMVASSFALPRPIRRP